MSFQSLNDYLNKTTNLGQIATQSWQKFTNPTSALTAGRWYNTAYWAGYPMLSRPGERLQNGQLVPTNPQQPNQLGNWILNGSYWNYNSNTFQLIRTANASGLTAIAMGTKNIFNGGTYGVEIWIPVAGASNTTITLGGVAQTAQGTAGQWHYKIPSTGTGDLTLTATATTTATISNISVVLFGYGVPLYNTDMGAMYIGTPVAPSIRQLLYAGLMSPIATAVPGTWKLVDMLMAYPVDMTIATSQALTSLGGDYTTNSGVSGNYSTWTVGADWAYASNHVTFSGTGTTTLSLPVANFSTFGGVANAPVIAPTAYTYNVTYTIASTSGSSAYTISLGGTTTASITTANGTFSQFITVTNATGALIFTPSGSGTFIISSISCTVAIPRYSNGAGVRAMLCWHSGTYFAATTIPTAAAHNISMTYTNSANATGQVLPFTVAGTSGAIPIMGAIDNSGIAANNTTGPFLPMAAGDAGVQSLSAFQLSAAAGAYTVGAGTNMYAEVILCREIMTLPNSAQFIATERDLMNQVRSLPQIQDGANLQWLFMPGGAAAANTPINGWLDYVWG
jgi:hypothetical protein